MVDQPNKSVAAAPGEVVAAAPAGAGNAPPHVIPSVEELPPTRAVGISEDPHWLVGVRIRSNYEHKTPSEPRGMSRNEF